MFDIESAIRQWKALIADSNSMTPENVVELESHLRETIADLVAKGLSQSESFMIASRRLGTPDQLVTEYCKVNVKHAIWHSIVHRCALLSALGALLGMLIGSIVWIQTPAQYKAIARIQISTSGETRAFGRDDVVILISSVVLRNAIEIGRFGSNPKVSDMDQAALIAWLRKKERLNVKLRTQEASSHTIDVSFRCDDQELSAEVVTAIVSGFEQFIQHETQAVSGRTFELNTVSLSSEPIVEVGKQLKRIEIPFQGFPDGPWLWQYLAGGGIIGACLFAVSSILLSGIDRSCTNSDRRSGRT